MKNVELKITGNEVQASDLAHYANEAEESLQDYIKTASELPDGDTKTYMQNQARLIRQQILDLRIRIFDMIETTGNTH